MMHHHYHTIRQWSHALYGKLNGAVLHRAYTLNKYRIRFEWKLTDQSWFNIEWHIEFQSCFTFHDETEPVNRPNAQPLYNQIYGATLNAIEQHAYNRSFAMHFHGGFQLIWKCYDGLSNILLFKNDALVEVFRKEIKNDLLLKPADFSCKDAQRIALLNSTQTAEGVFGIKKVEGQKLPFALLLSNHDQQTVVYNNIFDAYNHFSRSNFQQLHFEYERNIRIATATKALESAKRKIENIRTKMHHWHEAVSPEQIGHLIMANLHAIQHGATQVELYNFYTNQPLLIRLKKDLNAQQNAAWYYQKAKNRQKELLLLQQQLQAIEAQLPALESALQSALMLSDSKSIKKHRANNKSDESTLPFKKFVVDGYTILAGKGAANNDLLTLKHAHKNDIWLHAKDVSGSHVIIKTQSGRTIPEPVLEAAAAIAAYYSKLKGSSWVPVSYTEKKFVRKPKGFEPGRVVVDKEQVILVAPKLPYDE